MQSYYISTLGCPKNQADSRAMHRSMRSQGYTPVDNSAEADFHLINSCSFIESARVETIQTVLDAADVVQAGPNREQKIVLVGCFSERYAEAVQTDLPEVDLSFGTGRYDQAGQLIREAFGGPAARSSSQIPVTEIAGGEVAAPVKISDGCNRGCAFCAIPVFRGSFASTPVAEILAECQQLAREGIREICLVSQDTNRFGGDPAALVDLLIEIEKIPEIHWTRLLYLYPDARTLQIFERIQQAGLRKFVPYLESPVQHVSADVLRSMRRAGHYDSYTKLFGQIRNLYPELEIRTSFLIGFPGETEADIDLLEKFLREVRPEKLALFSYSLEEQTPGFELGDPIDEDTKANHINRIRDVHLEILGDLHRERVGKVYKCMIDRVEADGSLAVRRPQDAPGVDEQVFLAPGDWPATARPGDLLDVEITGFFEYDMTGKAIAGDARE